MSKGFILYNSAHLPLKVFVFPEINNHNLSNLQAAAEASGHYGMIIDLEEIDIFGAVCERVQLPPLALKELDNDYLHRIADLF